MCHGGWAGKMYVSVATLSDGEGVWPVEQDSRSNFLSCTCRLDFKWIGAQV